MTPTTTTTEQTLKDPTHIRTKYQTFGQRRPICKEVKFKHGLSVDKILTNSNKVSF